MRRRLSSNSYLGPFIDLPSKENGLDIEGLVVAGKRVLLGLRGPLMDGIAIVVELSLGSGTRIKRSSTRLLCHNLDGLGVRDLARGNGSILVLAGPVAAARVGPFDFIDGGGVRQINSIAGISLRVAAGRRRPGGHLQKGNGLLVVYDLGKNSRRIKGRRVRADWITGL